MKRHSLISTCAFSLHASTTSTRMLDPAKPEAALETSKRVQCGEADGQPAVFQWSGKIYSRVAGRSCSTSTPRPAKCCASGPTPRRARVST
jgi:hypothetical protein